MTMRTVIKTAQALLSRPDRADGSMSDKLRLAAATLPKLSAVQVGRILAHALYTSIGLVEETARDDYLLSPKQRANRPVLSIPESSESALAAVMEELPAGLKKTVAEFVSADEKARQKGIFPLVAAVLEEMPEWTEYERLMAEERDWQADRDILSSAGLTEILRTGKGRYMATFPVGTNPVPVLTGFSMEHPRVITDNLGLPLAVRATFVKVETTAIPADTTDH